MVCAPIEFHCSTLARSRVGAPLKYRFFVSCIYPKWKSPERARSFDASAASSERPLPFPRAGHTQAMWRHRATPLQPDEHREYRPINNILCGMINESRAQCQHMMRMRQTRAFEDLRGTRLVCTIRSIKGAQQEPRRSLPSTCRA